MSGLPRALLTLAVTALAAGLITIPLTLSSDHVSQRGLFLASQLVIGWSFVGTGLLTWWRRPENRLGGFMSAVGLTWLLGSLQASSGGYLFSLGMLVAALPYGFLGQMLLSFPDGRLHSRLELSIVGVAWFDVTVLQWAPLPFLQYTRAKGCQKCPSNPLLIADHKQLAEVLGAGQLVIAIIILIGLVVALLRRWRGFAPGHRRALSPVIWTGAIAFVVVAGAFAAKLGGAPGPGVKTLYRLALLPLAAVPFAFLAGLWRSRFSRAAAVSELVAALSERAGHRRGMRDALADAFEDPSLVLAYWLPERERYFDADGRAVELPPGGAARAWTPVKRNGAPLAAIIHDAVLVDERVLLEAAGAAAGLALENERLDAELRARVQELKRSRQTLIEAGLAERRKLERNLHDGAQQRLVALALSLRLARERVEHDPECARELLAEAMVEVESATAELRELARGIHPAVLSDRGLLAALKALTGRVPVPVKLAQTPAARLPARVEIASYYVVAEALTNIAKYASASNAAVSVTRVNGSVIVKVSDDGVGGADPSDGSGLRGLADRVGALDGRLEIHSPVGRGTTITAQIPCV